MIVTVWVYLGEGGGCCDNNRQPEVYKKKFIRAQRKIFKLNFSEKNHLDLQVTLKIDLNVKIDGTVPLGPGES